MSIDKKGEFKLKSDPRMVYQIMSQTRLMIIYGSAINIYRAVTVAARYSVCRRQFSTIPGTKVERKLLDYQTHIAAIGTNLANALSIQIATYKVQDLLIQASKEFIEGSFKLLDMMHHLTAGIKAYSTEMCYHGVDQLRQACGGIGFTSASGIVLLWQDIAPFPTFEGVNVMLFQQSSRLIMKNAEKASKGKECKTIFSYLNDANKLLSSQCKAQTVDEFLDIANLQEILTVRAAYNVIETYEMVNEKKAPKKVKENELFTMDIVRMTKHHLIHAIVYLAKDRVDNYTFKD